MYKMHVQYVMAGIITYEVFITHQTPEIRECNHLKNNDSLENRKVVISRLRAVRV